MVAETRRSLVLAFATAGALASCSPADEPKPSAVSTVTNYDNIKSVLVDLSAAVDDLLSAVGRFDDDNWREVVPDVTSAAGDVDSYLNKLKSAMAGNNA